MVQALRGLLYGFARGRFDSSLAHVGYSDAGSPPAAVLYGRVTANETTLELKSVRSNAEGMATMTRVRGDSVDCESKWATLTLQVR